MPALLDTARHYPPTSGDRVLLQLDRHTGSAGGSGRSVASPPIFENSAPARRFVHFTGWTTRYYDPATAQFLTRDPIDHITGDPYGYVNGNPNSYTDPTGQFGFAIPVVVAGGVALGIAACYLFCPDPPTPSLSVPDWMTINPLIPAVGLLVSPFSDSNDDAYSEPCGQWADDHLPSIGGSKERITPGGGAPVLGERDGRPSGADPWFHHDVIVKDGRVYDEANPNGVPTGEYEKQWEHPDGTNFPW